MKISIIIPYLNDFSVLMMVLPHLLREVPAGEGEIIIIDNGSFDSLYLPPDPRIRIIRNRRNIGVGGAFNQGVEKSRAEYIVLMGCDVIPQRGWWKRILETLDDNTNTIFNCVSSGFNDKSKPFSGKSVKRYGAHVLFKVTKQDLPSHSPLQEDPKFSKILQAKWNYLPTTEEFSEVRCLLGAFYWMHKSDYVKLRGWNLHKMWGSLEGMLSIKARAHGMKLIVDRGLEAAHYYGRAIDRPTRMDLQYYNMLLIAHTMFSDALRDELVAYLRYGDREEKIEKLNVNQARVMIKRNSGAIQLERDYNNRHFVHGLIKNWDNFEKNH